MTRAARPDAAARYGEYSVGEDLQNIKRGKTQLKLVFSTTG